MGQRGYGRLTIQISVLVLLAITVRNGVDEDLMENPDLSRGWMLY